MELKNKKILVVGAGKSGEEAAAYLHSCGARVSISETAGRQNISQTLAEWAERHEIPLETGGHQIETFLQSELIVVSPGVPLEIESIKAAKRKGIPVIGEVELAARFIEAPIIAITGTNGKSTTTSLIGHILCHGGSDVFVGGNLGQPLIGYVKRNERKDWLVVEISSFQLDTIEQFHPRIALLLNITEDHLDRYASFDDYADSKFRIFANQTSHDIAIINAEDEIIKRGADRICSRIYTFGHKLLPGEGAYVRGDSLICRVDGCEEIYSLNKLRITGKHNLENVMAAVLAARLSGCNQQAVQEALETFRGLPHRTEFVCEIDGVSFYDDSKGTNVGSVVKSLAGFDSPVILIAGGRDKGGSYEALEDPVRDKVKIMILIGEAGKRIRESLGHLTSVIEADSLPEAVKAAYEKSAPGDVVLLSPACSSFDMFRSYAERGDVFQKAALELRGDRYVGDRQAHNRSVA